MTLAKRVAVLVLTTVALVLIFQIRPQNYHSALQGVSQSVGLGEPVEDGKEAGNGAGVPSGRPFLGLSTPSIVDHDALVEPNTVTGKLKPHGEPYTRNLVIGRLTSENTTWLDEYMSITNDQHLNPHIYVVDDHTAPLHTPMNKGHEAMVYLTYLIDNYDSLADITIFMHPHRIAWHNPELLGHDAFEMLRRLSSERVIREGYMNLRCYWDPGCPDRLYPSKSNRFNLKREELALAAAWAELFTDDPIPEVIGAPCCAQFAVARERIQSIPRANFVKYRNWLMRTPETDWISGRVFEYLWHKIFANQARLCPDARACYCDGYGVCFSTPEQFEVWMDNHHGWQKATKELSTWEEKAEAIDSIGDWTKIEQMNLEIPIPGRNWELKREIRERYEFITTMRKEALLNGTDPEMRALVSGRPWKKGDGY